MFQVTPTSAVALQDTIVISTDASDPQGEDLFYRYNFHTVDGEQFPITPPNQGSVVWKKIRSGENMELLSFRTILSVVIIPLIQTAASGIT